LIELILENRKVRECLSEETLVVALDDTGHEEFKDPHYPVFGIGGCAFLVRDYPGLIENPWNHMCQRFFPDVKRPMHATDLGQLSEVQLNAFKSFFENFQFFRIATTASIKSIKEIDNSFIQIVGASLLKRICEIAKWIEFDRLYVLFERSDRVKTKKVIQSLSGQKIKRNEKEMQIEVGIVPKSASMPALEVTDTIIHTAGTYTKSRICGNKAIRKDYQIIFENVDARLSSHFMITKVTESKNV
jgi:hypothetical protein